jgi:hypothetical protein
MQSSFITLNCPPPPAPPTLLEELAMAVEGAFQRKQRAIEALKLFHDRHMLLIDLRWYFRSDTLDGQPALQRELQALLTEENEADRAHDKACHDHAQEKRRTHGRP